MWIFPIIGIMVILIIIYMIFGHGGYMGGYGGNRHDHYHHGDKHNSRNDHLESAMDILNKRYAKGEVTKEEFEQIKKDISG